jgi:hypothetical protein
MNFPRISERRKVWPQDESSKNLKLLSTFARASYCLEGLQILSTSLSSNPISHTTIQNEIMAYFSLLSQVVIV